MIQAVVSSPLFGIVLCILAFETGLILQRRLKTPLANPLLISVALIIVFLKVSGISYADFNRGGEIVSMLLGPATAVLALSVYNQLAVLKKYFLPILAGCLAGSVASMGSAWLLCKLFRLEEALTMSLIPKSVTTPIAMGISEAHGGLVPVTVAAVIITGILGAALAPALIKLFRIKEPIAQGVAIGTASHAAGTTKAMELGEIQGAMSSIAIGVSGLMTVVLSLFY